MESKLIFGDVFAGEEQLRSLEFTNMHRRRMEYTLKVDTAYADVFQIISDARGKVASRENGFVDIRFTPPALAEYRATLTITADTAMSQVELIGKGSRPTLSVEERVEFGIVSVDQSEFRMMSVTNTSTLPFTLDLEVSKGAFNVEPWYLQERLVLECRSIRP